MESLSLICLMSAGGGVEKNPGGAVGEGEGYY